MNRNSKDIIYKIQEFYFSLLFARLIALGISIYFILNFNDDPGFNGFIILFLGFVLLIATDKKSITATRFGIEIKKYNLLNVFTKKKFIRYKDLSNIEFTPRKFSIIVFFINGLTRSFLGSALPSSSKESVLYTVVQSAKSLDTVQPKGSPYHGTAFRGSPLNSHSYAIYSIWLPSIHSRPSRLQYGFHTVQPNTAILLNEPPQAHCSMAIRASQRP